MPHLPYHCKTGETLSVGKYVTSPDPGKRVNISKNDTNDVDYDYEFNGRQAPPFNNWWNGYSQGSRSFAQAAYAWSGAVWAPDFSEHGAMVVVGGGHGGNQGQFVYIFDLTTRRWSQVGAPLNLPPNFEWAGFADKTQNDYNSAIDLRDTTWRDYLYNGSYIMLHNHTYNTIVYVSPAEGGGNKGSLLIPSAPITQNPSDFNTPWAPHLFNLETGVISRATAAVTGQNINDNNNTVAVKDTTRSIVWYFRHSSITAFRKTLNAGGPPFAFASHTIKQSNGTNTNSFISCTARPFEYVPEADAIVSLNCGAAQLNAPVSINHIFDMSTGVPIDLKRSGLPTYTLYHGGYGPSMVWCPPQQAFYIYEGLGDTYCTVLRPSSLDFATCSWAWSREDFGGVPPANGRGSIGLMTTLHGAYRRMFWADTLGCLAWQDGPYPSGVCLDNVTRNGPAQLWRPPGKVIA